MVDVTTILTEKYCILSYVKNMKYSLARANQYGAEYVAFIKNGHLIISLPKYVFRTNYK
jgi:hypothetical protein